jgi:hypothetical protein
MFCNQEQPIEIIGRLPNAEDTAKINDTTGVLHILCNDSTYIIIEN